MQTLICLIRHGVTEWNYEGRAQGRSDVPLSQEGLRQAESAARRLGAEPWDAIYSSPLSRAYQTAEIIARRTGLGYIGRDDRLMERCMGVCEGFTLAERNRRWPGIAWQDLPGVESNEELAARAHEVLREIGGRHPGQKVICVAHGALISAFLGSLTREGKAPIPYVHQRNTSLVRVGFDGERFRQLGPAEYEHLLEDGVEYSGEKGRATGKALAALLGPGASPAALDEAVAHATAVECAWSGDRLVGFARLFTDGVLSGYVDLVTCLPGFEKVIPRLMERLQARYPDVSLTRLPSPVLVEHA